MDNLIQLHGRTLMTALERVRREIGAEDPFTGDSS